MFYSERNRGSSARPCIAKLLILSTAWIEFAESATSQKVRKDDALEVDKDGLADTDVKRISLLRREDTGLSQELPQKVPAAWVPEASIAEVSSGSSAGIRISSAKRGAALGLIHKTQGRHRIGTKRNGTEHQGDLDVKLPEGDHAFTSQCVDYPRDDDADNADPVSTGQFMCAGDACKENDYVLAKDQCCNCDGGAQYRVFEDTQCSSEAGLSPSGVYHGKHYDNPHPFQDVRECMMTCWSMGENCTGISIINYDSSFAGMCYFRMGKLKYVHDYHTCYNHTCQQKKEEVGQDLQAMQTTPPPDDSNDTDKRLPYCDDAAIFQDLPCTDNMAEARPATHTTTTAPPTQDEVVDDRDCWVKYLWWR